MSFSTALLLAGCSSSGDGGSSSDAVAEPEAADAAEETVAADPQVDTGERAVVYEASLQVLDPDPEGVAEAAWDLAESFGGFVTGDERVRSGDGGHDSAHLTLRIPSEHFSDAMDGLTALAESETHRSVTTEDVTEATVDLAARIATESASLERVRGLLAEAASVDAILELERELAEREGELASLEAQLEDLRDRVALSTVDFTVTAPSVPAEAADGGPDGFRDGLAAGSSGALRLLVGLSVVIGVLLPFTPIAAAVAAAVVLPIRWSRRRRDAKAAGGAATPPARR